MSLQSMTVREIERLKRKVCELKSSFKRQLELNLVVHSNKKKGILTTGVFKSSRVQVLHLSSKGDALVKNGSDVLMISSDKVTMIGQNDAEEGKERLRFIRQMYKTILSGNPIDTGSIYLEIQKWLL